MTIDGIVDAGYQSINYKGTMIGEFAGNGSSTSQINLRGSEDLGGGLKAEFRIETDHNMASQNANAGTASSISYGSLTGAAVAGTTASTKTINSTAGTFGNGELRVGLAGGFGRVDVGAVNLNGLTTYGVGQPYGTAVGSGFRGVYVTDASASSLVRLENSLKYTTPSFAGLTGTLYYVNKQTSAKDGTTASAATTLTSQAAAFSTTAGAYDHMGATELGLNYSNGPLNVSFSSLRQDYDGVQTTTATQSNNVTTRTLGANYTMGAITVYVLQQQLSDSSAALDKNFASVGLGYTLGNNVFTVLYGSGSKNASSKSTTMASAGYDYNLSKRTAVYARYESITDDASLLTAVPSVDGTDTIRTRAALGIRHQF